MNKTTEIIIGAIAGLALLGVIWLGLKPAATPPLGAVSNTNAPAANTVLANGVLLPNPSVFDYVIARSFLYTDKGFGYGNSTGIPTQQQGNRMTFISTSTNICSFLNPYTSTSTYEFSATVASTSANAGQLVLAVGNTTTATTTLNGVISLAANTLLTFAGNGTTTTQNAGEVGPNQYLNFGGNATPTAVSQYGGVCNIIWTSGN